MSTTTTQQIIEQIIKSNNLTNISFDHQKGFIIYLNYKDAEPNHFIRLKVFYNEGGESYNGNPNDKSIGYSVTYVNINIGNGYFSELFNPMDKRNFNLTIEKIARRNNKKLEALLTNQESLKKVLTKINDIV